MYIPLFFLKIRHFKENQTEPAEMKNIITEIINSMDGVNSRLDQLKDTLKKYTRCGTVIQLKIWKRG